MNRRQDLPLQDATWTAPIAQAESSGPPVCVLTLVWHPVAALMGRQAVLAPVGQVLRVNRFEPLFGEPMAGQAEPLGHPSVSRASLELQALPDGTVRVGPADPRIHATLHGRALEQPQLCHRDELAAGVMLGLGGRVVMCLHHRCLLPAGPPGALLGHSDTMERVRRQVQLVAATEQPVLILGETGTGKELIARAVHQLSHRRDRPWVAVNMAALGDGMAAAELFGSARGAYTGSVAARSGLWAEADGGTLFLDEVGDTPPAVQPMLLRAIETGEFRPLGASRPVRSSVRLVAATDRPLHGSSFNQPLLHRLESLVIRTPPLRERRQDLGLLIRQQIGIDPHATSWLPDVPPPLIHALAHAHWPGNVRQLIHAIGRLSLGGRAGLWPTIDELLGGPARFADADMADDAAPAAPAAPDPVPTAAPHASPPPSPPVRRVHRSTAGISPQALIDALDRHGWCIQDAARVLGVSRPSLYNLISRHPGIRPAEQLAVEDIVPLLGQADLTLDQLASRLRTPRESLRRRLRALGLVVKA